MNKNLSSLLVTTFVVLLSFNSFSQQHSLLLKSGTYEFPSESDYSWTENELINDHFYRIIAFDEIPTESIKKELTLNGIYLLDYLPKSAFFAKISNNVNWIALQNATVLPILNEYKLSRLLSIEEYPHWTLFGENQIEIVASYFESIPLTYSEKQVLSIGGTVVSTNDSQHTMNIRVELNNLNELYSLNSFHYFDVIPPESMPENGNARSNHRSNVLWTEKGNG